MSSFSYQHNQLTVESASLSDIANKVGTPCYVYSKSALARAYHSYERAFSGRDHLICYAVKANSSLAVLNFFARLGSGFDIVSGGELARVLAAGGDAKKIVFSGVGKTSEEIESTLQADIFCFNVESESELKRLSSIAQRMGKIARVSIRVNPDVDAKTHPYIVTGLKENKFGVAYDEAPALYERAHALPQLEICGIDCHIGSQLTDVAPFEAALEKILLLADQLDSKGLSIKHIDIGGGLGIRYRAEAPPAPESYVQSLLQLLGNRPQKLLLEPGRSLVGNAGVLIARVEYIKHNGSKNFLIVDAAMNDLMRPALYDAYHEILPLQKTDMPAVCYDVVGPVCETGDFLGKDRFLSVAEGDLIAIMSAGAYGMSMSSNYNTRPRAAEVWVDNGKFSVIRERESVAQLLATETLPR